MAEEAVVAPKLGTPEYDAAQDAKYREAGVKIAGDPAADPAADDDKPQRPEHIPEKFWDAEKGEVRVDDLAKSYAELEKGRSKVDPKDGLKIPEGGAEAATKEAVENAGLDWDTVAAQFDRDGQLDDKTIDALTKSGIPKTLIDSHVQLLTEARVRQTELAFAHVGGEEKMAELIAWAGKNLSEAEIKNYNAMLGRRDDWKTAVDTLSTKMQAANKTAGEPKLAGGTPSGGRGVGGFASRAEANKAQMDPRYQTDQAYRNEVAEKWAASNWSRAY